VRSLVFEAWERFWHRHISAKRENEEIFGLNISSLEEDAAVQPSCKPKRSRRALDLAEESQIPKPLENGAGNAKPFSHSLVNRAARCQRCRY